VVSRLVLLYYVQRITLFPLLIDLFLLNERTFLLLGRDGCEESRGQGWQEEGREGDLLHHLRGLCVCEKGVCRGGER
jgi:hypothetical protein